MTLLKKCLDRLSRLPWPLRIALGFVLLAGLLWTLAGTKQSGPPAGLNRPQPVRVKTAAYKDMPVYLTALGTAQPLNTVLVKSRVDGQLMQLFFEEGQEVKAGDVLAKIDPRPFEVQLKQAEGALKRDQALLLDARQTLARYRKLIKENSISLQQLQSQEALVGQYEGALVIDQANIESAKLQLSYCHITAPISGRLGLKKVDQGNMVRSSDTSGLVTITQMTPMYVVFTIVEKDLPEVLKAMHEEKRLQVEAYSQGGMKLIATGDLASLDNQVDPATGTVKVKAVFNNTDEALYPQQFTNIKLLVETQKNVLVVPASALQRDDTGFFVYLAIEPALSSTPPGKDSQRSQGKKSHPQNGTSSMPDKVIKTAKAQKIKVGYTTSTDAVVLEGLEPNAIVVVDGADRLRDNTLMQFTPGE